MPINNRTDKLSYFHAIDYYTARSNRYTNFSNIILSKRSQKSTYYMTTLISNSKLGKINLYCCK